MENVHRGTLLGSALIQLAVARMKNTKYGFRFKVVLERWGGQGRGWEQESEVLRLLG